MPLSSVLGAQSLVRPGVCTSSTRPASPFEGQVIYETDTDKIMSYSGSAWQFVSSPQTLDPSIFTAFTPTISSGGTFTIGNGTLAGRYARIGNLVIAQYELIWGSTTSDSGTGEWVFSVPVAVSSSSRGSGGGGRILDAGLTYYRAITLAGGSGMVVQANDIGYAVAKTNPMTWTTNDKLNVIFVYEA